MCVGGARGLIGQLAVSHAVGESISRLAGKGKPAQFHRSARFTPIPLLTHAYMYMEDSKL